MPPVMRKASGMFSNCIEAIGDSNEPIPVAFEITAELMQKVVDFCVRNKDTIMLPEADDKIETIADYAELVTLINAANMLDIPILLDTSVKRLGTYIAGTTPEACAAMLGLDLKTITAAELHSAAEDLPFLANVDSWWPLPAAVASADAS